MRPIDADEYERELLYDMALHGEQFSGDAAYNRALVILTQMPTLTPPNEPMLERVDQADSGCDRCSGPEDTALDAGGAHDFRVVGDAIYYCDSDYGWEGTKIKFCPWCGRSLASNTQVDILTGEKYEE